MSQAPTNPTIDQSPSDSIINSSLNPASNLKDHVTTHSDHPFHRRNSSMTSVGSSFTPRTASSASSANPPATIPTPLLSPPADSPLTTILNKLPSLTLSQQEPIKRTLDLINLGSQPTPSQDEPMLRLAHPWTLFFSDTSNSKSVPRSHHHSHSQREHGSSLLKAAEYQSGMSQVFTGIADVESLCASLSAFKLTIARGIRDGHLVPPSPHHASSSPSSMRRPSAGKLSNATPNSDISPLEDSLTIPGNGLGLIAMKPGHNLHFFRAGVNPVWEDPWNAKGGRLTIQPPLALLDPTFESIVLLIAGGVLETDAKNLMNASKYGGTGPKKEGGRVVGVVGSRRTRNDRIEIWLSGPTVGTAPSEEWIQHIQTILAKELGLPEARAARYKTHYH